MTVENTQPPVPLPADYWPGNDTTTDGTPPYQRSGMTKKDLLRRYDVRVKISKKWRADTFDRTWKRMIEFYKGKQFASQSTDDRIVVNVSFSTVNVIVPSIAVNYPQISVAARDESLEGAADISQAAVNYWWRRWNWRDEIKRTVKDSLVISHGWVKVGWRYRTSQRPMSADEMQGQYQSLVQQTNDYAAQNPHEADQLPSDSEISEMMPGTTQEVEDDRPYVERVSPFDMYIDPEATCIEDMKWIAQRIVAPLQRVKNDSRYKTSARKNLKPTMAANPRWRDTDNPATSDPNNGSDGKRTDDIQRVTLYEYWDIEHEYYCLYAEGSDDFLIEPTDFPYPFGHPFVYLPNYEVPDQFYSIGDLEQLEPMQNELNAVRSDMMNHRKRWQRAYLALRDKIDPEAQRVLQSNKDGRIVWVDGDEELTRIIQPIPQTSLDPQMYQYSDQIENDLELISGISEYQRGVAPTVRKTATEANMIQDATNARVSDKLAQVELFMGAIAERVIQLAQTYMTEEQVVRIIGPNNQSQWIKFDRTDIEGEFDFTVDAGSTQPKNEAWRQQNAMNLMQTFGPMMNVIIDPMVLIPYVLKEGFKIKDPQKFMMQQYQYHPQMQLREMLQYKDAPPDIQRQIEQQAGFQPSQIGGSSPIEGAHATVASAQVQAQERTRAEQEMAQQQAEQAQQQHEQQLEQQQQQQQAQAEQQAQQDHQALLMHDAEAQQEQARQLHEYQMMQGQNKNG